MDVEALLIAAGGPLVRVLEGLLNPYSFLYALILALIPAVWYVASQAGGAIIGHYALHICMRKAREEKADLQAANKELQEQNCRLMAVNALLVADQGRLRRANRGLFKRALKAELILAGPRAKPRLPPSVNDRNAGPIAG